MSEPEVIANLRKLGAQTAKLRTYAILARAIEEGIAVGLRRATKHHEWGYWEPELRREELAGNITNEAMNAVCEVVDFGD